MSKKEKNRNPVAKFGRKFNKAAVHVDRKKESKKTGLYSDPYRGETRCIWKLDSEA